MKLGNSKLTDPQSIANAFNNYFASIGANLANAIPVVNIPVEKYLCKPICSSFMLFWTTSSEIEDEINNLNPSKSTGPFSIPTKFLKPLKLSCLGPWH